MARGVAAGFWFNVGAEFERRERMSARTASVTVISGNPDIGGSRASLALMAAEELGVDYDKVRPVIADTARSASTSSPAAAASPSPPASRW